MYLETRCATVSERRALAVTDAATNRSFRPQLATLDSALRSRNPDLHRLSSLSKLTHYYYKLDEWLAVLQALARARSRLLIVTGFPLSIRAQIPKLPLIHPAYNLSGLSFRVLGTPLSYAWNQRQPPELTPSWEANLDALKASREWDPSRNDVAFLGCGAYGLPLQHHAKRRNISSVYVGGLLATLFGIHSKRARASFSASFNSHWMAPLPEETPEGNEKMEGGAYWGSRL